MKQHLKSPLITEKNTVLAEAGTYVFQVDLTSSKDQIKKEVETNFGVKVQKIRTAVCRDDMRYSKFGLTVPKKWKKAYVQLAPGQKISLFEGA